MTESTTATAKAALGAAAKSARPLPALHWNRNFILLWCAYGVSAMGDHLSEMAILKTQEALAADVDVTPLYARLTFMFFLPFLFLSPLFGLLADRLPRRAIMVTADLIRAVIVFFLGGLIATTEQWGTWGPFVPLLCVGTFAAMFSPARQALLPTIIRADQLVRANGMISGLAFIATMAAAAIGGYLADHYPAVVCFRLDAVTFVASAVFLLFLRPPRLHASPSRVPQRAESSLQSLTSGARYAWSHRHVLELLCIASLIWFCAAMVNSVVPAVVRDVYGGTYTTISAYRAFLMAGLIGGALVVSVLGNALRSEIGITWGLLGIGVGIGVFALSVFLPAETATLARIGATGAILASMSGAVVMASFNALLQRTVANRFRGRVFGVKDVCTTAAILVATGALGVPQWVRVDRWVGYILFAVALLTIGAGAWTLRVRLRRSRFGAWVTFLKHLIEFVARLWWRFERIGHPTVPREGPAIVTSNHVCAADPLFLTVAAPYRLLSFLVAAEYVNWPVVRYFSRKSECIPVRRGTRETSATKEALGRLREGKVVSIFIEGGIVPPGQAPRLKDGVALLALRTQAPVIPAYISGAVHKSGVVKELFTRHRARVRFGPPVDLSEFGGVDANREAVRAATRRIYEAILSLAPEEERARFQQATEATL